MQYYNSKLKAVREDRLYKIYTTDSFYSIVSALGGKCGKRYADLVYPQKEDNRDPHEIAIERARKLGLKVVS